MVVEKGTVYSWLIIYRCPEGTDAAENEAELGAALRGRHCSPPENAQETKPLCTRCLWHLEQLSSAALVALP